VDARERRAENGEWGKPRAVALFTVLGPLISVLVLSSCGIRFGGNKSAEQAAAALREENAKLRDRVTRLEAQAAELTTKLAEAQNAGNAQAALAAPALASIEIESISGPMPRRAPTRVSVYVRPLDGRGRFMQAVGTLRVTVLAGGSELGSVELNPEQLREAYRSGFAGTAYVADVPVPPGGLPLGPITMRATLTDAASGRDFSAERVREENTEPNRGGQS
jgi:cell division protein FtsB